MRSRIDPSLIPPAPNLSFEQPLWQAGLQLVAGIDEAGRGALAGPVAAGAAILPIDAALPKKLMGVRDSKEMNARQREEWFEKLQEITLAWGVGFASAVEIDTLGIIPATRLAMQRALSKLVLSPEHLLIDALFIPDEPAPQTALLKGDRRSLSIAAASIFAKVSRDRLMCELDVQYPHYGLAGHKGYGTAVHRAAIVEYGPCEIHRKSFAPMRVES